MKYTYNEFVSLIDNCDIAFDAIAFDAMATFHFLLKSSQSLYNRLPT